MSLMMPDPLGVDTSLGSGTEGNDILAAGNENPILAPFEIPEIPDVAGPASTTTTTFTPGPSGGGGGPRQTTVAGGARGAVVDFATKFLGDPYVWGGTRPGGFDCSGLLQYVLAKAGKINLPRISAQQARFGNRVGYKELRAGDLVAWDNSSRNNGADHIALYIGNGWIIEAPRAGLNVRKRFIGRDLDGGWGVHIRYTGDTAGSTRRPV